MKQRFQGESPAELMSGQIAAQIAAAGKFVVQVYKSADETVQNSSALQDDNHLLAQLASGRKYWFRFQVLADPAAIGGMSYGLGGTATATNLIALSWVAGVDLVGADRITTLGGSSDVTGQTAIVIDGAIEVNAGGTLVFRWAQSIADNAGPTTVLRGSLLTYQEI